MKTFLYILIGYLLLSGKFDIKNLFGTVNNNDAKLGTLQKNIKSD